MRHDKNLVMWFSKQTLRQVQFSLLKGPMPVVMGILQPQIGAKVIELSPCAEVCSRRMPQSLEMSSQVSGLAIKERRCDAAAHMDVMSSVYNNNERHKKGHSRMGLRLKAKRAAAPCAELKTTTPAASAVTHHVRLLQAANRVVARCFGAPLPGQPPHTLEGGGDAVALAAAAKHGVREHDK
jgi:hypothetical protein